MRTTVVAHQGTRLTDQVAGEIRAWLGRRRWSQARLARELEQSPMWLSERLSGEQDLRLTDLERIAEALDISIVELFPDGVLKTPSAKVPVQATPTQTITRTECEPDVRSPAVGGIHRRPKVHRLPVRTIAA